MRREQVYSFDFPICLNFSLAWSFYLLFASVGYRVRGKSLSLLFFYVVHSPLTLIHRPSGIITYTSRNVSCCSENKH